MQFFVKKLFWLVSAQTLEIVKIQVREKEIYVYLGGWPLSHCRHTPASLTNSIGSRENKLFGAINKQAVYSYKVDDKFAIFRVKPKFRSLQPVHTVTFNEDFHSDNTT